MRKPPRGRFPAAFLASLGLHLGLVGLAWVAALTAEPAPKLRVYAVDIVSPPPQVKGEYDPIPGGTPKVVEAPPAPEPEPEPEPEPAPPPPPKETPPPPKEAVAPAKAAPKKEEPKKEAPKPAPAKETPKETPKTPAREAPKTPAKGAEKAPPSKAGASKGTEVENPAGTGKTKPSSGENPDPSSPGGEDLNVKIPGARFVEPGYLENIQRQVNRYFRRPSGARTDMAEVQFYIRRDGSVEDIEVVRNAGSFAFRVAAMEAVEQAGLNKAFGPLPKAYPGDRLLVSFYFRPAR